MLASVLERVRIVFCSPPKAGKALAIGAVALGLLGIAWLVHATGGVKFAALHAMYLPVIFSALVFGTLGGVAAGVAAGLLLGPYMPLDTVSGEPQQLANWLMRTMFFCTVGGVVGIGASALRRQLTLLDCSTSMTPARVLSITPACCGSSGSSSTAAARMPGCS